MATNAARTSFRPALTVRQACKDGAHRGDGTATDSTHEREQPLIEVTGDYPTTCDIDALLTKSLMC